MNKSGIYPVEYKVLIKPEQVEEKTSGGIILVDETRLKDKLATVKGTLVAVGAIAFTDPNWLDKPKVGHRVMYDRYAGGVVVGDDGEEYRLISDKEIGAILRSDA